MPDACLAWAAAATTARTAAAAPAIASFLRNMTLPCVACPRTSRSYARRRTYGFPNVQKIVRVGVLVCERDRSARADEGLRREARGRRPLVRRASRDRHGIPRAERVGQVDDDALDSRARPADEGHRDRQRQAISRARCAVARGRRAARGTVRSHGPLCAQPPAGARADAWNSARARRRADRPRWLARG